MSSRLQNRDLGALLVKLTLRRLQLELTSFSQRRFDAKISLDPLTKGPFKLIIALELDASLFACL